MYACPDHPADGVLIARDHVKRAYWAMVAGRMSEAAAHLAQALWPPKNPEVYPAYAIPYWFRAAAQEAYEDLVGKREGNAVRTLRDLIYPYGVPVHEAVAMRYK